MPEKTLNVNKVMPGGIDTVFSIPIPSPEAVHVAAEGPVVTVSIHHDGAPPVPVVETDDIDVDGLAELVAFLDEHAEWAEKLATLRGAQGAAVSAGRAQLVEWLETALSLLPKRARKKFEETVPTQVLNDVVGAAKAHLGLSGLPEDDTEEGGS